VLDFIVGLFAVGLLGTAAVVALFWLYLWDVEHNDIIARITSVVFALASVAACLYATWWLGAQIVSRARG
jgi:dolichyl-phosphate-mannose--protein O-mannosyl transferase